MFIREAVRWTKASTTKRKVLRDAGPVLFAEK